MKALLARAWFDKLTMSGRLRFDTLTVSGRASRRRSNPLILSLSKGRPELVEGRAGLRRQDAVTITTFALIAPILLFIIFGISESARIMYTWMVITNEAAEAARYGSVHYDRNVDPLVQAADVKTFISQRMSGVLASSGMSPTPSVVISNTPSVAVTIYYKVDLVIPLVAQFLPNPFPLAARSVMAAESS